MQLPYHQQRLLRRIGRTLRRSDPQLAAMLAMFAQLHAGDVLEGPEQHARVRWVAWLLTAAAWLAASVSACAGALSRAAMAARRLARARLGVAQHSRTRIG
jgi:hypothetical protein